MSTAPSRLTVIVPTRQRHDTLASTLQTCITQDSDDLTILVSDNASTRETRELVDSLDDPRIRYVNPGDRLGMSEHWDFALSHVDGGYVSYLGDDDGLMPGAADEILSIVGAEDADALIWPLASYYWPQFFDPTLANCLSMDLPQSGRLEWLDSALVLASVAAFERAHYWLPSPYWGAVRYERLARLGGSSGRVFRSITPDVYSGVGVAAVTESYLRTDRLMSLSGSSRHSNGASQMTGADRGAPDSPVKLFESENGIPFHTDLVYAPNIAVLVAECLIQAHDQVDPAVPRPEMMAMFRAALRHPDHVLSPAVHAPVIEALRAMAQRHDLVDEFEATLRSENRASVVRRISAAVRLLAVGNPIHDCSEDGVTDIFGATVLADRMRRANVSPIRRAGWSARGRLTKARRALGAARAREIV